jgi:NADPH2:quinone reductase
MSGVPEPTIVALTFTGAAPDASRTEVAAVAVPVPGVGQVSIDVEYSAINFKDVMSRRGDRGYVSAWPFVPGLEVAGRIRSIGAGVTGFTVGDRVAAYTGDGGLAEVALADAGVTVVVPDGVAMSAAAAATGVLVTAWLLLGRFGRVGPHDAVLVHGAAGGVGRAIASVARVLGVGELIGTVGSEQRVAQARSAGYDRVIVRGESDDGLDDVDGSVDLVLDPQGTSLLERDLALLAPAGRVIVFGNAGGDALESLPPLVRLMARNASVGGFSLAGLAASAPAIVAEGLEWVLDRLAESRVDMTVTVVDGLAQAALAQQALAEGRGAAKYVVRIAG